MNSGYLHNWAGSIRSAMLFAGVLLGTVSMMSGSAEASCGDYLARHHAGGPHFETATARQQMVAFGDMALPAPSAPSPCQQGQCKQAPSPLAPAPAAPSPRQSEKQAPIGCLLRDVGSEGGLARRLSEAETAQPLRGFPAGIDRPPRISG